jgi:gliding motility-associated-like protein
MNQRLKYYFSILMFTLVFKGFAGGIKTTPNENEIKFAENKNQWNQKVLFRAQLDGGLLFLEKNAFTYNFYDKETLRNNHMGRNKTGSLKIRSHAFRMTFLNSSPSVTTSSKTPTSDYCNYFYGKDKSKWVGDVKNYKEINYQNIYDGIDIQVLGMQNSVKYNFIVSTEGNPNDIKLNYEGLDGLSLKKGMLIMKTSVNEMIEEEPYAYQFIDGVKTEVPCKFVLEKNVVRFDFPEGYNKGYELVIDPILVFACSSGSTADNFGMTATYDAFGDLYSGGTCFDIGFPTTLGAYDTSFNGTPTYGNTDVVITKYSSNGTSLLYSTYLGGATGTEIVTSLIVDAQDNLLLYGATGSSDFPVTASAYDQTFNGGILLHFIYNGSFFDNGTDIYVAKFNSGGTSLLASTYIGGSMNDGVNVNNDSVFMSSLGTYEFPADSLQYNYGDQYRGEIQVDPAGNCYIASSTRSGNFPIVGGFDNTLGGKQDAVVFKFDSNLSTLLWSSYLGGSDNDAGYSLIVTDLSEVYVTGGTRSNNFPTTAGSMQPLASGGKADGYITRINSTCTAIINSTYIGTNNYDQSYFIQSDDASDIYVFGQSLGAMPVINAPYSNANAKQFVTKLDKTLSTILFSTRVGRGGSQVDISPSAFLIDNCKNIYLSGWGGKIVPPTSTTFSMPLTSDAIQPSTDGHNFYLMVLSAGASSLLYATYFGGASSWEHVDGGTSRFDKKGIIYQSVCAGCGGNDDFPVTPGSWPYTSPTYVPYVAGNPSTGINMSSNCNNGTFKFNFQIAISDANFTLDHLNGCAPLSVQFQNLSSSSSNYLWDFGNGDTSSVIFNPLITFTIPGTYLVQLYARDPTRCNVWDTIAQSITVYPSITANFSYFHPPCSNEVTFSDSSAIGPVSWLWDFGDGNSSTNQNPIHTYGSDSTYNVQLITQTVNGCKDTVVVPIVFSTSTTVSISPPDTVCPGLSSQLNASGGVSYSWSPTAGLNNPLIANPVASPDSSTTYTVSISTDSAGNCVQMLSTTIIIKEDSAAFFTNLSSGCPPLTVQFQNLGSNTSQFMWDFDNGNTSTTAFNPSQTYTNSGVYNVHLYSKDTASCGIWDTVIHTVTVYPSVIANFGFAPIHCTNQINFTDSSLTAPVSWIWNFGDGDSASVQNPSHSYGSTGTFNVQLITSTINGCKDSVTIPLSFSGLPLVSVTQSDTLCLGSSLQLNSSGGISYSWSPTSSLSNPLVANPIATPVLQTTYTVTIQTVDSFNDTCAQMLSTTIYIKQDTAAFSSLATAGCSPLTIQFQNLNPTSTQYLWNFGNGNTSSTTFNPSQTYTTPGTYNVQLYSKDTASCRAWDTVVHAITVYPGISTAFSYTDVPCTNQFSFHDASVSTPTAWYWDFDDGNVSYIQNPTHVYASAGNYSVQLVSTTINGCKDSARIQINNTPAVTSIGGSGTICMNAGSSQLSASGGFAYSWSPASSLSASNIPDPVATPNVTTTYSVNISTTNALGETCIQTQSTTIGVYDNTVYTLTATTSADTIGEGTSTTIHAISNSNSSVHWTPTTGINNPNSLNPVVSPEETTTYTVSILDSTGCPKTASVTVYVVSMKCSTDNVFVPNTFTPNGDGENDVLYVRSNDIDDLYFAVYNRWGQMVFETTDITKGWDGTYNGMKADPAVFAWYLRAKCFNGNELKRKGNTTLIR